MKYFFFTTIILFASTLKGQSDTLPLTKNDDFYIDRSGKLLVGLNLTNYNYDIIFRNISANIVGGLKIDYNDDNFPYKLTRWKFTPSVNRNFASVFASCRYGSYSYSKSLDNSTTKNTQVNSFQFSIPIKTLSITIDYLKFTGMYRENPVTGQSVFLNNMMVRPFNAMFEYSGKGTKLIRNFNSLKNNFMHTPKHHLSAISFLAGYSDFLVRDSADFIPALAYADSLSNPPTIKEIHNKYLNEFTSKGGKIGFRLSYYVKLHSNIKDNRANVLYLKFWAMFIYNVQFYQYKSLTSNFDNTQFRDHQKGNSPTQNILGYGALVWDLERWYLSAGANYSSTIFGSTTGSLLSQNSMRDQRYSFQFTAAYRLPFAGVIRRVNRILGK